MTLKQRRFNYEELIFELKHSSNVEILLSPVFVIGPVLGNNHQLNPVFTVSYFKESDYKCSLKEEVIIVDEELNFVLSNQNHSQLQEFCKPTTEEPSSASEISTNTDE